MHHIKLLSLVLAVVMLSLLSCKTSDDKVSWICGTANPLEDIPWLREIKELMEINTQMAGSQIIRYKYKGDDVFWIDMCYNCADNLISVHNCQGDVICEFGGIAGLNTCIDFQSEATDSTMLFNNVQQ
jgi:hypothetical protein